MATNFYYYTYLSDEGPVSLIPEAGGRYKIYFKADDFGTYADIESAFTAAVTGELQALDLPGDLDGWQKKLFMSVSRLRAAP